ncbi:hypothetical protein [Companilactobacillus mishanensis]|uniref:Uncharacterized protein n=1 Tax=Companilactobacillus mishanensis TaxID=2486008 RepID=A0ABW9P440_9LACO|nr:hypothetical protein [Companilactobacillus mishanensis]MQS43958.1 hypothetical protein [Companilactobacillus mishanensis]
MTPDVRELANKIDELGYDMSFGTSNDNKPFQQLWVYKRNHHKPIAKVSLVLQCRINTMFNGIGRNDSDLLKVLYEFSLRRH